MGYGILTAIREQAAHGSCGVNRNRRVSIQMLVRRVFCRNPKLRNVVCHSVSQRNVCGSIREVFRRHLVRDLPSVSKTSAVKPDSAKAALDAIRHKVAAVPVNINPTRVLGYGISCTHNEPFNLALRILAYPRTRHDVMLIGG